MNSVIQGDLRKLHYKHSESLYNAMMHKFVQWDMVYILVVI